MTGNVRKCHLYSGSNFGGTVHGVSWWIVGLCGEMDRERVHAVEIHFLLLIVSHQILDEYCVAGSLTV